MTTSCVRGRTGRSPLHWFAAVIFLTAVVSPVIAAEPIAVQVDQAKIIKVPERAATIVIGDPLIADLSIQPGGIAVITGKGYGATNVIVMDASGAVLTDNLIEVTGPSDQTVVVYRGVMRNTYSCTPDCSPRIMLGDDSEFFTKNLADTSARNTQALAAASSAAAPAPQSGAPSSGR